MALRSGEMWARIFALTLRLGSYVRSRNYFLVVGYLTSLMAATSRHNMIEASR